MVEKNNIKNLNHLDKSKHDQARETNKVRNSCML